MFLRRSQGSKLLQLLATHIALFEEHDLIDDFGVHSMDPEQSEV
jgi:hypothetical protein